MQEDYRPKVIEFDVANDSSNMPDSFGKFDNADEAVKYIGGSIVSINQAMTVHRHMDQFEKSELRKEVADIMENRLPVLEKDYTKALSEFNSAKKREKEAKEMVNAAETEAKMLAKEVKEGVKDIRLDEAYTFRVPYRGKYYFYTFMDGELKLCQIGNIPEHEKSEIWNAMAGNEEFIDAHFGDEQTEA